MLNYICTTCGIQFKATAQTPDCCPICEDERQYVNPAGQQWTTLDELKEKHKLIFHQKEQGLYGVGMQPNFGIGQRALLVITPEANILWDCISLVNQTAINIINALGGLDAIAISHPHYYTTTVEWSRAFGDIPVYLHQKDQSWVMRDDSALQFWEGDSKQLTANITLYNPGGHFAGATVLHWQSGADGKGALLTGDILQVASDREHVSFMYSFPNNIPLNEDAVRHISTILDPLHYDRIYGAWWDKNILSDAKTAVNQSVDRYINAIN